MEKRSIGIGIIGWGFMGKTHTLAAKSLPLFYPGVMVPQLNAVASRRMESALEAQRDAGFSFVTDDWRELLSRDDVQAVSICTPNALHEEMAIAALEAGKHVYIDKPLTINAASAARIESAAVRSDRIAQMAYHLRFLPCAMRAKELIEEGRLGKPLSFRIEFLHSGSVDPDRPASWKSDSFGAGVMLDLGSHAIDMLEYLFGEIGEVLCRNRTLYPARPAKGGGEIEKAGEDACLLLAKLKSGAVGSIEASKIATGSMDEFNVRLDGDKGALRFGLSDMDALYFYDNTIPEAPLGGERGWKRIETASSYPLPGGQFLPSKNSVSWLRAHIACYYNFINCIQEGRAARPSVADGLRTHIVMDAAMHSDAMDTWKTVE